MANWVNEAQQSSFEAQTYATSAISNRSASRESSVQNTRGFFGGLFDQYSVVGLNANKVPAMREAIRNYVNNINAHLEAIDPKADANSAFKSEEVQEAVKNYVTKVKEYCQNLISDLLAFSDKLADVQAAWEAFSGSASSNINAASGGLDAGAKYTEQK